MKRSTASLFATLLLLCTYVVSGCTVYDVAVEERNVSTYTDDRKRSFIIEEQFLKDDTIKYLDFDAYSYEGHVYILGEYESRFQANRAVEIAKSVEGVKTVTTYFIPKRNEDSCGLTDNMDIEAKLRQKLVKDDSIWSTNIDSEVIQCTIILLGIVGTEHEKELALNHAMSIPGVREVKSYIKVR